MNSIGRTSSWPWPGLAFAGLDRAIPGPVARRHPFHAQPPGPASPRRLSVLLRRAALPRANRDPERARILREAIDLLHRCLELEIAPARRVLDLLDLAWDELESERPDQAANRSDQVLDALRAGRRGEAWALARYRVGVLLGRIALRRGDLAVARSRLIEAGHIELRADDRPDMSLARELFEQGEREVVEAYFRLVARSWPTREARRDLRRRRQVLRSGASPFADCDLFSWGSPDGFAP